MDSTAPDRQKLETLQRELIDQTALADSGETAAVLAHEVNDFLNTLTLQLAVLEHQMPKSVCSDLEALRRQGARLAALVRLWQQSRRQSQATGPVDLNQVVRETVESIKLDRSILAEGSVELALDANIPSVAGSIVDMRRLCAFLIKSAIASSNQRGGKTTVRTGRGANLAILEVSPGLDPEEPLDHAPRHGHQLELACCRRLVERLKAGMEVEKRGELEIGTGAGEAVFVIRVKFPGATST